MMTGVFSRLRPGRFGLIAVPLMLGACGGSDKPPEVETFTVVETVAEPAFDGEIAAGAPAELSFAIGGTVESVLVAIDDGIKRGDALARLDADPVERAVEAADAALQHALGEQAAKTSDLKRKTDLAEKGQADADLVDQARAALDDAAAAVDEARRRLAAARVDLDKLAILAPFDGVVTGREVDPFEEVAAGQVLFMVTETAALYAAFTLPPGGDPMPVGQPVSVEVAAIDATLDGIVTEITDSPAGDGGLSVSASLVDPPASLRAGSAALVTPVGGPAASSGYLVPVAALVGGDGGAEGSVFLYVPAESVVRKVLVTIGEADGKSVRVTEGLSPGDIIVVTGVAALSDGQKVTAPTK